MKIVLITGGSGAIGSALVPRFLDEPGTSVRLLLRADSEDHLAERLARLLRYWETPPDPKRIEVLRCDLHEPRLGLSAEKYQQLAAEITHCVHAAGNVKLNERLETALEDAVGGTARVLDLIDSARHRGVFRKLEYVSTIGVAGRLSGRVPEARLEQPRTFHNTYEEAKARAESLVLERMRAGLPASVHRPSMVVGDSATGKIIHFQVFYYLCEFLAGLVTAGRVPEADASSLDIIPCDYVARAIQVSSESEDGIGRIFHLCSGPDLAVPISELTQFLRRTFGDFGVELPVLRPLPAARLARLLPRI
ncbi:MAG TPA: SDR family oxidoreductase, partial [Thermoanaerobaculia bacterium]|nr:SDR family oxidoreductase [Thermoanaerobaculia bacterium]